MPDTNSYHYTGGPMIRAACTQRPPVGGISVKEVMEISITPFVLQVSLKPVMLILSIVFKGQISGKLLGTD